MIQRYILRHAHDGLLGAEHAATLLELSQHTSFPATAGLVKAAVRLRPETAGKILPATILRLEGRLQGYVGASCACLLAELAGKQSKQYLVDWFYRDYDPALFGSSPPRTGFVGDLFRRLGADDLALLEALVADARSARTDYFTTREFLLGINNHSLTAVVSRQQLYGLGHPFGMSHFHGWIERAAKEHPAQTKAVLSTLERWRGLVRTHLPSMAKRRRGK